MRAGKPAPLDCSKAPLPSSCHHLRINSIKPFIQCTGGLSIARPQGDSPVIASLVHYDLYLDGGWGTLAAPVGLAVPLEALTP